LFASGEQLEGFLSISEAGSNIGAWRDVEGGLWRWCDTMLDDCAEAAGVGILGYYGAEWVTAFTDTTGGSNEVRLVAVDFDGVVGETEDGRWLFQGPGRWYFEDGGYAAVGFAMRHIAPTPVFESATMVTRNHASGAATPPSTELNELAARAATLLIEELRSTSAY
jgi:hypothetical protein